MHVVHVVRDLDETSGGISRSVPALASALAAHSERPRITVLFQDRGHRTVVDGQSISYRDFRPGKSNYASNECEYLSSCGSAASQSWLRCDAIEHVNSLAPIDFVHLHGLWSPSVSAAAAFARRQSVPYAIAPRGMLSEWAMNHRRIRKWLAWAAYQKRDLAKADFIHVTSEAEHADVLRLLPKSRCALIPNAIETGSLSYSKSPPNRLLDSNLRWCLALGRIHPIKGLDRLIDAWSLVRPPGWGLAIAGPDEGGYTNMLATQAEALKVAESIRFLGSIDDGRTGDLLASADLVVQASHSENFGIVIAESLAAGTPVIASRGTPWQSVQASRCGWWVDNSPKSLAEAIKIATELAPSSLEAMGRRGTELIRQNFGPSKIASLAMAAYAASVQP